MQRHRFHMVFALSSLIRISTGRRRDIVTRAPFNASELVPNTLSGSCRSAIRTTCPRYIMPLNYLIYRMRHAVSGIGDAPVSQSLGRRYGTSEVNGLTGTRPAPELIDNDVFERFKFLLTSQDEVSTPGKFSRSQLFIYAGWSPLQNSERS